MSKSGQEFLRRQEEDFIYGRLIRREDAILHVDVYCYDCKRLVAMSYTIELDGRRYCWKCGSGRGREVNEG